MKHYINKNKEIFGFELDGSQDHLITPDMKPISLEDIEAMNKAKEEEYKKTPEYLKQYKKQLLDTITVTTSKGNTFDGNESSRNNMLSAIKASDIFNVTENNWKLADNTVASITLEELEEALALSISRAGTITLAQSMEELNE